MLRLKRDKNKPVNDQKKKLIFICVNKNQSVISTLASTALKFTNVLKMSQKMSPQGQMSPHGQDVPTRTDVPSRKPQTHTLCTPCLDTGEDKDSGLINSQPSTEEALA